MAQRYLLDTNIISEYRRINKGKAHPSFVTWQKNVLMEQLYLSSITIMELNIGILRLARKDNLQANDLHQWLHQQVLPEFEGRILDFDTQSAFICSKLHVPDPRSERDAMIASIALANGLLLVTRNIKDFALMNMDDKLINPFV